MEDFSGLSQGVRVYSRTGDYTGRYMTNPTVPAEFTGVTSGQVFLGRHVIIGTGSVILPKASIGEGMSVGALSLVTKSLDEWGVYTGVPATGVPAKWLKPRSKDLIRLERQLLQGEHKNVISLRESGECASAIANPMLWSEPSESQLPDEGEL